MFKVSVIVPIYNSEKYLNRCIDSIVKQTYKNLEIILVDDGSTDKSGIICDEYKEKDHRIKVIHKKNEGVSSARNSGIDNCEGDYVIFLDSDDYIEENMCQIMLDAAVSNCVDIVISSYYFVKEHSREKYDIKEIKLEDKRMIANYFCENIFCNFISAPWCKLYKKDLIKEHFLNNISIGEDTIFNVGYFNNISSLMAINIPLYNYNTTNKNSLTKNFGLESYYCVKILHSKTIQYAISKGCNKKSWSKVDMKLISWIIKLLDMLIQTKQETEFIYEVCEDIYIYKVVNNFTDDCPLGMKIAVKCIKNNRVKSLLYIRKLKILKNKILKFNL